MWPRAVQRRSIKNSNRHFVCPLSFCEFLNYSQQQLLLPNPEQGGNQGLPPDHQDMALLSLLSHPTGNNWALTMCQVLYKVPRSIIGQTWWTISSGPHLREELSTYILKPLSCRWNHIVLEADFQDKMSTPSQFWWACFSDLRNTRSPFTVCRGPDLTVSVVSAGCSKGQ